MSPNLRILIILLGLVLSINGNVIESKYKGLGKDLKPLEPSENYMFSVNIDEDDANLYKLFWNYSMQNEDILFEIHCKTLGWVGFGLSPTGNMVNSDIAIGWVDNNGKAYLYDTYATAKEAPLIDAKQDLNLIDAIQIDGYTILKFSRKFITCDKKNDFEIKKETNRLILAWNDNDPTFDAQNNPKWSYHQKNKRIKSVMLLDFKDANVQLNQDSDVTFTYELKMNNHLIPQKETYYYCQLFKMPKIDKKHHMIGYDIIISKESRDLVHHMDIYDCNVNLFDEKTLYNGTECGPVKIKDSPRQKCSSLVVAWAVGGNLKYRFPNNMGLPFAPTNRDRIFLIEYHYNNGLIEKGRTDSSGVKLLLTDNLKKTEIGVLTMASGANTLAIQVPPKLKKFTVSSICYSKCTQKFLPETGINVFTGVLHTHLSGRTVRTKLVRNNEVIGYVFNDPTYDFNYQSQVDVEPVRVQKGDTMILECIYNSMDRNNFTFRGHSTMDEMCINFMYYYPRVKEMDGCLSTLTNKDVYNFYKSLISESLIPEMSGIVLNETLFAENEEKIVEFLEKIQVNDKIRDKFKKFFEDPQNQMAICGSVDAIEQFEFYETPFYKPIKELKEPEEVCKINTNDNKNSATTNKMLNLSVLLLLVILAVLKL